MRHFKSGVSRMPTDHDNTRNSESQKIPYNISNNYETIFNCHNYSIVVNCNPALGEQQAVRQVNIGNHIMSSFFLEMTNCSQHYHWFTHQKGVHQAHILIASSSRYYTRIVSLLYEESNHTETGMCEYH